MPVLIIIALYRNTNVAPCKSSTGEECLASQREVPIQQPQVFTEPQMENEMSLSAVDKSRPFNPQIMRPSSITYMKIKGGWIDIEQLFPY